MSDEPKRIFTGLWIPVEIVDDQRLMPTDKMLWAEIHAMRGENNEGCYASSEHFAKHLRMKPKGVEKAVVRLKALGLVYTARFDGRRRWLKVIWPKEKGEQLPLLGGGSLPLQGEAASPSRGGIKRTEIKKKVKEQKMRCTQAEAEDFCESIGLPRSDGEAMFFNWEGKGWKAVKDWRAVIRSWKLNNYLPSQKNAKHQRPNTGSTRINRNIGTSNEGKSGQYAGIGKL